ncbi:MAG: putative collagen-binding domain-containing protein, partial [Planctomycetota bacterium]
GYKGFDNTQTKGTANGNGRRGLLHEYTGHVGDYNPGDPAWDTPDFDFGNTLAEGGDARNIIGYLNYLSSIGVNSQYFLANNIGGDGQDSHPFANISTPTELNGQADNDNLHYDISKLTQWETVFRHAQQKDIHLHFVLNEAETPNKEELDDATLGVERKLYYRELVARFGHHNSLQWNLSEEYDLGNGFGNNRSTQAGRINEFADWLADIDPYESPTTVHQANNNNFTNANQIPTNSSWEFFVGDEDFDLTSLQRASQEEGWSDVVEAFRTATDNSGRKLSIHVDEPESITRIDVGANDDTVPGTDALVEQFNTVRKTMTWDILLSGGGGVEWFINNADQDVEDQRIYEKVYVETAIAREFLEENTRFWEMTPNDDLLSGEDSDYGGGEVFAIEGEQYAIYLPDGSNDDNDGGAPTLDLTAFTGDEFTLRWFNPQTGEFDPTVVMLAGGTEASLGSTPSGFQNTADWAALVLLVDGDANGDSFVSAADYAVFRDTAGAAVRPGDLGDADGSSLVDQADYDVFVRQFGPGVAAGVSAGQAAV